MKLYSKGLLERILNRFGIGKSSIAKYLYGRTALAWDLEFEKQILLKQMKKILLKPEADKKIRK